MRIFYVILLLLPSFSHACDKEIVDDVCPQREGTDGDCDRRCREAYPGRMRSQCELRNSGTLLSLFGIRSFVCKCYLPLAYCQLGADPIKLSYSVSSLQTHSVLNKLLPQAAHCNKGLYQCSDSFTANTCDWQRSSEADWFEGKAATEMPFAAGERPDGLYLAMVGRRNSPEIRLSSCENLCSKSSVEISSRLWRAPWIKAELCFNEGSETVFCGPTTTISGAYINETLPETKSFSIYFKFSNVSEGDVIMMDDLNMGFVSCPPSKGESNKHLPERSLVHSVDYNELESRTLGPPRVFSANTQRIPTPLRRRADVEALRRRYCRYGECAHIHQPSHQISGAVPEEHCTGREGLLRCKAKCKQLGEDGATARCLRQKDYPFTKRCVCQTRKAPVRRIEGGSNKKRITDEEIHRMDLTHEVEENEVSENWRESPLKFMDLHCGRSGDDAQCDRHCKKVNSQSSGYCTTDTSPKCECTSCTNLMCDFDGDECGWTDLRLLSQQFNNISIAAKKDRQNRYGLSTINPLTYSGLLRRGWIDGPVNLSVDIYPSEEVDVRICVDSLYKCQSQTVSARAWNRVAAKIKVNRTDKIFLLIYNSSKSRTKTIALDNISLTGGNCR